VLQGIARALRLSDQERSHLFALAGELEQDTDRSPSRLVDPATAALLDRLADERDFTRGVEIRQVLERLPPSVIEPLVMQNIGGLSCEEIAQALGVTVGAAATRICRARSAVREVMTKSEARPARRKEVVR
jgi:DNA-directed RNA polymerase specialized sigma24 family protein